MPELSGEYFELERQLDRRLADSQQLLKDLMALHDKKPGEYGANIALKQALPEPYLLRHVCLTMLENTRHGSEESMMVSAVPDTARILEGSTFVDHPRLCRIMSASEYLIASLLGMEMECFHMICLDKRGRMKENVLLHKGVYDAAIFSVRYMLENLRRVNPDCIILCHNHPGGTIEPSQEDIECTQEALEALTAEGVPMLDHMIVCNKAALSMRANRYIPEVAWLAQHPGHRLLESYLQPESADERALNRKSDSILFAREDEEGEFKSYLI